jgi:U4/U6 small nuclear ribonucleoprotein PRP4
MVLDGHVKEILAMDFAPNGYQVATGSGDDTVRIWDLRALKTSYIIPAHKSSVSDIRFFRSAGEMPFVPLDLKGSGSDEMDVDQSHDGAEMNAAANGTTGEAPSAPAPHPFAPTTDSLLKSGLFLVTAGFDNHVRIWSADEWSMVRDLTTDAGKVMSADISGDGRFIASASYSRSFHLFGGDHSL